MIPSVSILLVHTSVTVILATQGMDLCCAQVSMEFLPCIIKHIVGSRFIAALE